jgi:hypothetical protein
LQVSGETSNSEVLELYKLAVEMADRVSSRRGIANSFFLTVQTAMVTVLGFTGDDLGSSWWASALVAGAGIALSATWWLQLKSYRDLNKAKFDVILAVEKQLPVKIFSHEWDLLKRDPVPSWRTRYAELGLTERRIPLLFAALHVLLFVGRISG